MNRKWLAGFTFCVLILGFAILRAQSPAQSETQALAADPGTALWLSGDPGDGPVTIGAVPLPDPAAGDFFFLATGPDVAFASAAPDFAGPLPFPPPDPQAQVAGAGGVAFVGPDGQNNITFVGFQAGLGNKVVTGAPYTAQITSEFEQTLQDGNKIDRKTSTTIYRDGQGRERREQTLPAIGSYSAASTPPQAIFINDPVGGVTYVLDPVHKTARKMPRPNFQAGPGGSGPKTLIVGPGGPPPGNGPAIIAGPNGPGRRGPGGPPPGNGPRGQNANVVTESLGAQNIEGILVQGTRVTRTIPAGAFGNRQPIQVTSERWYSPKLQMDLVVKNIDPTRGTNTTTLSNIQQDEPPAPLFQVPADYTVQEINPRLQQMRQFMRGVAPPPPPPAPPQ